MNDREAIKILDGIAISLLTAWSALSDKEPVTTAIGQTAKAIDMAQAALQERVERNKGWCAWCKAEYTIIDDDFGRPIRPNMIKFCWHCGRKLKEEQHGTNKAE